MIPPPKWETKIKTLGGSCNNKPFSPVHYLIQRFWSSHPLCLSSPFLSLTETQTFFTSLSLKKISPILLHTSSGCRYESIQYDLIFKFLIQTLYSYWSDLLLRWKKIRFWFDFLGFFLGFQLIEQGSIFITLA